MTSTISTTLSPTAMCFVTGTLKYREFIASGLAQDDYNGRGPLEYFMWSCLNDTPYTCGETHLSSTTSAVDAAKGRQAFMEQFKDEEDDKYPYECCNEDTVDEFGHCTICCECKECIANLREKYEDSEDDE